MYILIPILILVVVASLDRFLATPKSTQCVLVSKEIKPTTGNVEDYVIYLREQDGSIQAYSVGKLEYDSCDINEMLKQTYLLGGLFGTHYHQRLEKIKSD